MKVPNKVRITFYVLGFLGAALFIGLLIREGAPQVGKAITTAGWAIIAVIAFHFLVPVLLDTLAWWVLFPRAERPSFLKLYRMRWIGESVTTLIPSAAVGGDIVRARLAAISGTPIATAAATVLVDLTLGVFTQAAFTILGIALLVSATGSKDFVRPTLIGTVIGVVAVCGFYLAQRAGMFRFLARMIAKIANSPEWHSLIESGETLDTTVRALYARRAAVFACCGWTIVSLILNSGEIYIALWALNLHPTILNAIILQSMALTIRSAAFAVPGGIGVQEGGYVFVACLLGLASDTFKCGEIGFALSAISRVRELAFGIPGLITWQLIEGRRLIRSRAAAITS